MATIRELRARFTATAQGFKQSVQQIQDDMKKVGDEGEKGSNRANEGFTNLKNTLLGFAGAYLGFEAIKTTLGGVIGITDEYQRALSTLQTRTGATQEEIAGMEESLKNIYKNNYGESFEDIAQSMSFVKTATGLTGQELEKATQNAIMLRDTFEYDVQESTRVADTMMKQFGITSDEAFTLIAQGSQNGLDKHGDMMDSFNEYSVYFKQLGFDAEGMWNVFKSGAESGAFNMDKVGDAVKEFGIRVKDESKTTIEAFEGLGLNADNMAQEFAKGGESSQKALQTVFSELGKIEDPVKRNTIGVALFGTQFEDLEHETVMALGTVQEQANMSADTLQKIDEVKYTNILTAFEGFKRMIIVDLLDPIQKQAMPLINDFINNVKTNMPGIKSAISGAFSGIMIVIQALSPIVGDLFTIFKNIAPIVGGALVGAFQVLNSTVIPLIGFLADMIAKFTEWEGFIPVIAGLGTAIGVYLGIVNAGAIATGLITNAVKLWTIAQRGLNLVMAMNPIGLIVSLIAGLIVALVLAYQKSETFRDIVNNAWTMIKTTVSSVIEWFKTTIPIWINNIVTWFKNMGNWISGSWTTLKTNMINIWNSIVSFIVPIVQAFVSAIVGKAQEMGAKIMEFISPLITFFQNTWNNIKLLVLSIIGVFLNLITGNFEGLKISLLGIWTAIKNQVINIVTTIKDMAINIFNAWKTGLIIIVTTLKDGVVNLFTALKNGAVNTWNALKNAVINGATALKNGVVNTATNLKNGVVNAFNSAKDMAINSWNALKNGVSNAINNVKTYVSNMKSNIISTIKGIDLSQIGKDIIQGLINGIGNKIGALKQKITDVTSAITGKIKGLLDINSPSRVFMQFGEWTGEGLAIGIENMKDMVTDATGTLADASIGTINEQEVELDDPDFDGTDGQGGPGAGGTNYNAPLMNIENYYQNDETDVRSLSNGLYNLQRNSDRKKGK